MRFTKFLVSALLATAAATSQATVVNVVTDTRVVDIIPGLTGFATTGAQMAGLLVTATFSSGYSQTLAWATTGTQSGGVSGSGWGLSVTGDTFSSAFNYTVDATRGQLTNLILNASGSNQVTLFDTTFNNQVGTPNSASGLTFAVSSGCASCNVTATYSNVVAIVGSAAVGDLFHILSLTFVNGTGPTAAFAFRQDIDNDSRLNTGFVPEPGAVSLLALGLLAMGAMVRRRK